MSIIHEEDLPAGMKKRQKIAHEIAKDCFSQTWNVAVEFLNNEKISITGNDALAFFGTLIGDFTARWLMEMIKIADKDDAGIPAEDVIKDTLNGIAAMLGGELDFEEDKELPHGIKRIKKANE